MAVAVIVLERLRVGLDLGVRGVVVVIRRMAVAVVVMAPRRVPVKVMKISRQL